MTVVLFLSIRYFLADALDVFRGESGVESVEAIDAVEIALRAMRTGGGGGDGLSIVQATANTDSADAV